MLQTLIRIPHEVAGLPVFGLGWLMILWGVATVAIVGLTVKRHGWGRETNEWLRLLLVVGVAVVVVMPFLEVEDPLRPGEKLGLLIRGYGVMMLLGVIGGVGMAMQRGRRMGYHPDAILSVCVWMFIWGIIGARAFYTIQYWDRFYVPGNLGGTLAEVVNFTKGGLVVYGAVIGAVGAAFVVVMRNGIPVLEIADIISPAMLVGLALGRVGCFFNGCCWGGACELPLPAVQFPAGSQPYMEQIETGRLLGVRFKKETVEVVGEDGKKEQESTYLVTKVEPDSMLLPQGIQEGDVFEMEIMPGDVLRVKRRQSLREQQDEEGKVHPAVTLKKSSGRPLLVMPDELPSHSRRIHPSQLYSAINAALLVLLTYAYFPYRKRNGEVFALTMTLYPLTRTLLEMIRNDEVGQLGTSLTVSQWVSVVFLVGIVLLWIYIMRQPPREGSETRQEFRPAG